MKPLAVQAGDVIAGKYRIDEEVASGAMGLIFAATHTVLGEQVAVKVLRADSLAVPSAMERFRREAQATAKLKSPYVCRTRDAGLLASGEAYIVMELLAGHDISVELKRRKQLPLQEAARYVLQTCHAIAEAHSYGIVHRDLKPSNLFLARQAEQSYAVKVLDFGISKMPVLDASGPELTKSAHLLGSPLYMSPEQIRSPKQVDARSDVWSLGVVLHEMVVGAPPFQGETLGSVLAQITSDSPPPLRSLMPEVPEAFERLVLRCLERDVAKRFQSVVALARELEPYAPSWQAAGAAAFSDQGGSTLAVAAPEPAVPSASRATVAVRSWGRRLGLALLVASLALVVRFAFSRGLPLPSRVPVQPSAAAPIDPSVAPPPSVPELRPSVTPTPEPPSKAVPALPVVSASASAKPQRGRLTAGTGGRPGTDTNGGGAPALKPAPSESGVSGRGSKVNDPALSDR